MLACLYSKIHFAAGYRSSDILIEYITIFFLCLFKLVIYKRVISIFIGMRSGHYLSKQNNFHFTILNLINTTFMKSVRGKKVRYIMKLNHNDTKNLKFRNRL